MPSGSIATKSNTIRFSVRELYTRGAFFFNDFTTRVNSYIGTTIVVPDVLSVVADTMNTQVHDTTKQTPYELVFGQPPRVIFVPDVNFRGQLDDDVLKPCDREISEEGTKDKEQDDEGN